MAALGVDWPVNLLFIVEHNRHYKNTTGNTLAPKHIAVVLAIIMFNMQRPPIMFNIQHPQSAAQKCLMRIFNVPVL